MRKQLAALLLLITCHFFSPQKTKGQLNDTACASGTSLYQLSFGGNKEDAASAVDKTADGGIIIAGRTASFGNGKLDGFLMKLDKTGKPAWSKAIGGAKDDVFYSVKETSDKGFIVCGHTTSYGSTGNAWLVRMDAFGNLLWSNKYGDENKLGGDISYEVTPLSDGGFAFVGSHRFSGGNANGFIVRTDPQGKVIWSKHYGTEGSDQISGIIEDDNYLVVSGFYRWATYYDCYLMKIEKSDGEVVWSKGFDAEERSTWSGRLRKTEGGYQMISVITDNYFDNNQQPCIWNFHTNGAAEYAYKPALTGTWTTSFGWVGLEDGGFISVTAEKSDSADLVICNVNVDGSIRWSRKYPRAGQQTSMQMAATDDGGYVAAGWTTRDRANPDSSDIFILKIDGTGKTGSCQVSNAPELVLETPDYKDSRTPIKYIGRVKMVSPAITVGIVNFVPNVEGCSCPKSH